MSGGKFDYQQYTIDRIADEVEQIILDNSTNEYYQFSDITLNEFRKGLYYLRMAAVYIQRIDWLVSADDSEESFHERLANEIQEIKP